MSGSGREYITVHFCGNANGDKIAPYILYKAKHLYQTWTPNGPTKAMYGASASGWMEKPNFYSWFAKGFLPEVRKLKLIPPKTLTEQESTQVQPLTLATALDSESGEESNSSADGMDSPGVILFFHGNYPHINLDVIDVARKNNVTLVTLPPNTSHALQPLDVCVFATLKRSWQ